VIGQSAGRGGVGTYLAEYDLPEVLGAETATGDVLHGAAVEHALGEVVGSAGPGDASGGEGGGRGRGT
jgi:hypothetical protein